MRIHREECRRAGSAAAGAAVAMALAVVAPTRAIAGGPSTLIPESKYEALTDLKLRIAEARLAISRLSLGDVKSSNGVCTSLLNERSAVAEAHFEMLSNTVRIGSDLKNYQAEPSVSHDVMFQTQQVMHKLDQDGASLNILKLSQCAHHPGARSATDNLLSVLREISIFAQGV